MMILVNKPVKLMEWGEGTNTLNQVWTEMGQGNIVSAKREDGVTTVVVEVSGQVEKKNSKDDAVKLQQQGQGMTPKSRTWTAEPRENFWGEVAMGRIKSLESSGGKSVVQIEISAATKIGRA